MKNNKELKTSRVCLAGRFNTDIDPYSDKLEASSWNRIKIPIEKYDKMSSHYYPSLLLSMVEVDGKEQSVCRYEMILKKHDVNDLMILKRKDGSTTSYPCAIVNVQLWFFPFGMVLFSIEIEEHTQSLSDLSLMHSAWKNWSDRYEDFHTENLDNLLNPLLKLSKGESKSPSSITYQGTKIRQYQLIETDTLSNELLYELGSFSPIGVVAQTNPKTAFKPSDDYFDKIIRENSLSVFSNWKALALNDSFTILAIDDFFEINEFHENFEFLYMRCLFEEFYCFDRNNLYRENDKINNAEIENEISFMEKHYFFDDMSYDFLPPLMYRIIAKGLELPKDREQLIQHVKQSLRNDRLERNNIAVNFVQIFAIVSVIWTIRGMLTEISCCFKSELWTVIFFMLSLSCMFVLLKYPQLFTKFLHNK